MDSESIARRVEQVREKIAAAAARAGRAPEAVTLVAVTKTRPPELVRAVLDAGVRDVGENRVQELEEKVAEIGRDAARWHLVGHLQRNKVKRTLPLFDLLHSLDSLRLARKVSDEAMAAGVTARVLAQVNTSGEESKYGFTPAEAPEAIAEISGLPGVSLEGLMTMAPLTDEEAVLRRTFAGARRLAEDAVSAGALPAPHLSMGMSNDYEIAVEEGSTLVRLGTVLFGEREG